MFQGRAELRARKSCAACGSEDAMKAKKLKEALQQMAEEGVVQLFSARGWLAGRSSAWSARCSWTC